MESIFFFCAMSHHALHVPFNKKMSSACLGVPPGVHCYDAVTEIIKKLKNR